MKKYYRIGICLVLVVCLLFLSACGKKQDTPANNSAQATGEANNNPTYANDSQIQPSETANPENEKLVWSSKLFDTFIGPRNTYSQGRMLNRLTYNAWQETVALNLETHSRCAVQGYCHHENGVRCGAVEYLESTNYDEAYFAENTFLVINLQVDNNNAATLKDVRYADGVLTCYVELERPIRRIANHEKTVYIQIETFLQENTELKLEITSKEQPESELALQWKDSYLRLPGTWALYEKDAPKIAKVLTWESYQTFVEECKSHNSTCPTYTEEFFAEHSLVVLGLSSGSGSTIFEVYDLHYVQGALTCFVDRPNGGGADTADMASWLCFIEVDTILPEETKIICDTGIVKYDYDTYLQKHAQFQEQLIK